MGEATERRLTLPETIDAWPAPESFLLSAEAHGIQFEPGDLERLGLYLALLAAANEQINLTRITEPDEMWMRHIFDSLTLLPIIVSAQAKKVIDIGSGGGAPGIPLAAVLPDVSFTLLEATGKKAAALEQFATRMGLTNVTVVADRAETAGRDRENHREKYDLVTARAVGPLRVLVELTTPFARVGGLVCAVKGEQAEQEIADAKHAFKALHVSVIDRMQTPTGTIVVMEKTKMTGKAYPRRPGEPKRAPL